jgi:dolichol-phosphate mannosyltransferase
MNMISDVQAPAGATDFRLVNREVADAFASLKEHRRLTRALIDWVGFKRVYVHFDAHERANGHARYGYTELFHTAFSAIVAHSRLPLALAGYLGVGITCFAAFLGAFVIVEQMLLGDPLGLEVSGTAMLAIMILFLNGIVLISLGLMSAYIGTIHVESADRPLYIIRKDGADTA